jgi:epoxyqueuosine reductase
VPLAIDAHGLTEVGLAAGLDAVGIAAPAPFAGTRAHLEARKGAGLHGGMAFTYRNPARSTDPGAALAGVQAIVVGARAYDPAGGAAPSEPVGRVAAYARRDEYEPLRAALRAMADVLRGAGWRTRVLADDNSLVDREAAYRAGIGWYGKSSNLLLPGRGSWFVLGSVLTTAPLPPSPGPVADGCGGCRRCLDGCPTGAIIAPGVVDARRCLAWLVQRAGTFPLEHRADLGDRIYGCDDCQDVCPPNRRSSRRASDPAPASPWVSLLELLAATDDALLERHGWWYIAERDPRWLRRNALIALGNVGAPDDPAVAAVLERYASSDDDVLAEHATWARERIAERTSVFPSRPTQKRVGLDRKSPGDGSG